MAESQGFALLHPTVQRWVWQQGWTCLRDIQERAVEPILRGDRDVIISAATATGKTEAAFLPACSRIAQKKPRGVSILYISPLKALINDLNRRLRGLCELLDLPLTPWHGDVPQTVKNKQFKKPSGILLITPESLESLLINRSSWCAGAFANLGTVIVDEFHAFLGSQRGCQLLSLLHRLEFLAQRPVPRVALSATLADMERVAAYLRPDGALDRALIVCDKSFSHLKVQVRGYVEPPESHGGKPSAFGRITADLYKLLRGRSHLLFANSRSQTEEVTTALTHLCEQDGVPNEFFPHHGNLSKHIREQVEFRLQQQASPTTAVCTSTLELGIDIGRVDSVAQLSTPPSVASLRQRLGRSGRRGNSAVLRMFVRENALTSRSDPWDRLRLETVMCAAMVNLLLCKWYEPPPDNHHHFSTLAQQTLSVIAQYGAARADQLWRLLCGPSGPFAMVDSELYAVLLRALGRRDLVTQLQDGQLTLGTAGERLVAHYGFYTAFCTPQESYLEYKGRVLGSVPMVYPLNVGDRIIFAGRYWKVVAVDHEKSRIVLRPASRGKCVPFTGSPPTVHDRVRQEMRAVYLAKKVPRYLNAAAGELLAEGIACFHDLGLARSPFVLVGQTVHLFPWLGDRITQTIARLLKREGLATTAGDGMISVTCSTVPQLRETIAAMLKRPKPKAAMLMEPGDNTCLEKHDMFIPKQLREVEYAPRLFDIDGAWAFLQGLTPLEFASCSHQT
ncbi:MAG: DEAD/DEAH box helicase [Myxococcota bacterium]